MSRPPESRRRSIRIPGYDYTQWGSYFVTLCAWQNHCSFGSVVGGALQLSEIGRRVEACWEAIPAHFSSVELDEFIVMPNHVHGILMLSPSSSAESNPIVSTPVERFGHPVAGSVPTIIRSFKAAATRDVRRFLQRSDFVVWQRNYYEHVVRDENALVRIRQYIIDNPARWEFDPYNPDPSHRVDIW